ncbi:MAG: aminopeptidase [Chloroflexota bacterium]
MMEAAAIDLGTLLDRYADLLVTVGANVQPGQQVMIGAGSQGFYAPVESADFVAILVEKAYAAGASDVHVTWFDPTVARLRMQHATMEQLTTFPSWTLDSFMHLVDQDAAFLSLHAPNPHLYRDIDPERVTSAARAEGEATRPFSHALHGTMSRNWTVGAVATNAWARLLFPDLTPCEAIERTWEVIGRATRADVEDPIAAWRDHLAQLNRRENALNRDRLRRLHYRAPGTDLTVDLLPGSHWMSCANVRSKSGVPFVPNIPSDEVFTTPLRTGVNGTVRSTLPLNYRGALIENIALRFDEGKVVEATADRGADTLAGVLETDPNARYLGEIALVPADAALAQMRTIFYNTLFDENASCHLALGNGFAMAVEGGAAMSRDDLVARGVNQSATHVDFMIGTDELDIDGETESGETVPVFRRGVWAKDRGDLES